MYFNAAGESNASSVADALKMAAAYFQAQSQLPEVHASVQMSDEEKAAFAEKAIHSPEGKLALAQAMQSPVRKNLDYRGIARRTLQLDVLPQGAIASYDLDIDVAAVVVSENGAAPETRVVSDRQTVATFGISANPTVGYKEVKTRRFNIIDRAIQKARQEIQAQEDANVFAAFRAAAEIENTLQSITSTGLLKSDLISLKSEIEDHDLVISKFLLNIRDYNDILRWGAGGGQGLNGGEFDMVTMREVQQTGLLAHIWGADIMVSKIVPRGNAIALADADFVGVMPIVQDIEVIPADEPKQRKLGWVVYEEIGVGILNPRGVAWATKAA
jgi:hypothetical protein